MRQLLLWTLAVLSCVAAPVVAIANPQADAEAEDAKDAAPADEDAALLKRILSVYVDCKTYVDTGKVSTLFVPDAGQPFTNVTAFKTAFVRPDRLLFEFESRASVGAADRYIVWRKGDDVRRWWSIENAASRVNSIEMALGEAVGISQRSAYNVPSLLMPDLQKRALDGELSGAKRIDDAPHDGKNCYRFRNEEGSIVWVDKATRLICRIDRRKAFDGFRTESTTTYDAGANVEVKDKQLAFEKAHDPARKWNVVHPDTFTLIHGCVSVEHKGPEQRVVEHAGGGTQRVEQGQFLDLSLEHALQDGKLYVNVKRDFTDEAYNEDTAVVTMGFAMPEGALMGESIPPYRGLTSDFRVLWQARVRADDDIERHVYYVARVVSADEEDDAADDFSGKEIDAALKAITKADQKVDQRAGDAED